MKTVYLCFDGLFTFIWGLSMIELVAILWTNTNLIFSNVDNGTKALFSIAGLIYFALKIFFFYHKSTGERKLQAQQIRNLEIENNKKDIENFMFGKELRDMKKEDFEESQKRLEK